MNPTDNRSGQEWMRDAACARTPGLPWTADTGTFPDVLVDLMTETCDSCPVYDACNAYAETAPVTGGWWAGEDRDPDAIWHRIEWVPVHGRKGRYLGEQAALPLWDTPPWDRQRDHESDGPDGQDGPQGLRDRGVAA